MATTPTTSYQAFLSGVTSVLQAQKSGQMTEEDVREKVRGLMHGYLKHGDKEYAKHIRFCDMGYSRTHLVKNEHFELLVLCWKKGQASKIHNHAGSHCWMGVVQGHLNETLFGYEGPDGKLVCEATHPIQPGSVCPKLHEMKVTALPEGEVAYASDKIGLHRIATDVETGDSVSLHLYAPPIVVAKIFCPETNLVIAKRMCGNLQAIDKESCGREIAKCEKEACGKETPKA